MTVETWDYEGVRGAMVTCPRSIGREDLIDRAFLCVKSTEGCERFLPSDYDCIGERATCLEVFFEASLVECARREAEAFHDRAKAEAGR